MMTDARNMTVRSVLSAVAGGASVEKIVSDCLDRIKLRAELNNFISIYGGAINAAAKCDELEKSGAALPLLGVPFAVKDNIDIKGLVTTCASRCQKDNLADKDAEIVKRLKAAGAVLVGKTNMDEFAMGSTNEYSAYGCVKNALDMTRVPGGSSGGSANAVAAGQVAFAIGTDTGGSVRQPAAFCGVVGLKPTAGAINRDGLFGLSPSLDSYGIFAADCDGVQTVFDVLTNGRFNAACDVVCTDACDMTIGVADEFEAQPMDAGVKTAYLCAVKALEKAGARVVRVRLPSLGAALAAYHVISSAEAARTFAEKLGGVDLSLLGGEVKRRIVMGRIVASGDNYESLYIKAAKVRAVIAAEFAAALDKCDVIVSPATPTVATKLGSQRDPNATHAFDAFSAPVSLAGLPAMSVPFGSSDGMPAGLQIIGKPNAEHTVLRAGKLAEALDNA